MGRVRIGTCSGPADAALVRSVFDAHGIPIVINAEQHASVLGGLGGAFVPLHIYVDDAYAEDAAALLEDLRGRDAPEDDLDAEAAGAAREGVDDDDAEAAAGDDGMDIDAHIARRRRTAIALLLGCCVTFGTAHMSTGAWFRGLLLAGLELLAIRYFAADQMHLGTILLVTAVVADVVGGVWRARTLAPRLPVARTVR